jgi:hypothetical protein
MNTRFELRSRSSTYSGWKEAFDALGEDLDIFRLVAFRLKQLSPCLILIW